MIPLGRAIEATLRRAITGTSYSPECSGIRLCPVGHVDQNHQPVQNSGGASTVSQNNRFPDSDEEIPRELAELGRRIAVLSDPAKEELLQAHQRVVESVRRRRRILSLVQEALSQLRLDIKYLMFDLEVTRQERDELKQQLEDH